MPTSVIGSYSGDAAEFARSLAGQPWLILAAIITIYIVLGVLYESIIHPITILSTLPSAGLGALLALMLLGYDLSVIALIGIVLLMGIVKKNAIMMIDFALEAERVQGMTPRDSIVQAALLRFRPIMMTTLAALFGAIPLAVESGTGSELRNPLGHHHHRRPAAEPVAHALHHAGDLPADGAAAGALEPQPRRHRRARARPAGGAGAVAAAGGVMAMVLRNLSRCRYAIRSAYEARATASPPPLWGRGQGEGAICRR